VPVLTPLLAVEYFSSARGPYDDIAIPSSQEAWKGLSRLIVMTGQLNLTTGVITGGVA
jgi:hypothetical protein